MLVGPCALTTVGAATAAADATAAPLRNLRRVGADWDLSDMNFLLGSRTMRNRPVLSFELPSIATSRSHHSLVSLAALPLAQHLEKHQATSQHDSARAPEGR